MRNPRTSGWILVAVCLFAGLLLGATGNRNEGVEPALSDGWTLLFATIALALGFFVVPMIAGASEGGASPDRLMHLWLFSGLAPLALLGSAFVSSVLSSSPEWSYLITAAVPFGITLRLSSIDDPLESGTNLF